MSKRNESIISFNNRLFETAKMMPRGEGMNMIGIIYSNIKEFISVRLCREEDWSEYENVYHKCTNLLCNDIRNYVIYAYTTLNNEYFNGFINSCRKFMNNFQQIPSEYSISNLENGLYLFDSFNQSIYKCKKRGFFIKIKTREVQKEPTVFIRSEIIFSNIYRSHQDIIPFEIIRNHGTQPDIHTEKDIIGYIDALKMEPICNIIIGNDPNRILREYILNDVKINPSHYVTQKYSIITDLKINSLVQFDKIAKEIYKRNKSMNYNVNGIFFTSGSKKILSWSDNKSSILLRTPEIDFSAIINEFLYSHNSFIDEIYISLYRFDIDTEFPVKTICNLSQKGVKINVFLETKARDNEKNALDALMEFREAGVTVVIGYPDKKVHAKLALVKYKDGIMKAHIGTGNYSESSQKCFHDLHFITSDEKYTLQVYQILKGLMDGNIKENNIVNHNRERILSLIEDEITKGHDGRIIFKCNNICDEEIIQKLYDAADAGVNINIIARTVCTIHECPNLSVMSVCGRYLEHDRIYQFGNRVFISSSDIMSRNLDHRIESFVELPGYFAHCLTKDLLEQYINLDSRQNGSIVVWDMKDDSWIKRNIV